MQQEKLYIEQKERKNEDVTTSSDVEKNLSRETTTTTTKMHKIRLWNFHCLQCSVCIVCSTFADKCFSFFHYHLRPLSRVTERTDSTEHFFFSINFVNKMQNAVKCQTVAHSSARHTVNFPSTRRFISSVFIYNIYSNMEQHSHMIPASRMIVCRIFNAKP